MHTLHHYRMLTRSWHRAGNLTAGFDGDDTGTNTESSAKAIFENEKCQRQLSNMSQLATAPVAYYCSWLPPCIPRRLRPQKNQKWPQNQAHHI